MIKKINLKTRSLYIGCYDFEDESAGNWHTFVYAASASDDELERYFREVVYEGEYGETLGDDAKVDVYELREAHDYRTGKDYKVMI